MEELLHYVWKHRIFPLNKLTTTTGQQLEIIDAGLANKNAGPDFFNAKIKINGVVWVGNIEIHTHSSDWFKHGHHQNPVYNNVILHVATCIDTEVHRSNGESIPQMQLTCPEHIRENFKELANTDQYPPCYRIIPSRPNGCCRSVIFRLNGRFFARTVPFAGQTSTNVSSTWKGKE